LAVLVETAAVGLDNLALVVYHRLDVHLLVDQLADRLGDQLVELKRSVVHLKAAL
jgi:hypothetical protein